MSKDLTDKQLKEEIQRLHQEKSSNEFNSQKFEELMALEDENDRRLEKSQKR